MQGRLSDRRDAAAAGGALDENELAYAVALSVISCPGAQNIWRLIRTHGPSEVYRMVSRIAQPATQAYCAGTYHADPVRTAGAIIKKAGSSSFRIMTFWDPEYPGLLREIPAPPVVLYVRGDIPAGSSIAVVGTRRSESRSAAVARRIACELAGAGFAVVSGMAVGIDREAHLGALDAGGATVGVLANGIDIAYPWPNRDLYRMIESSPGSALVSEYPPGIIAGKWTFVRRNRIISGLCAGTVVVKAGNRSGALITARHAVEQNREVFACPGNSFEEEYAGCHQLIQNGAVLVSKTDDIISEVCRLRGMLVPERVQGPEKKNQPAARPEIAGRPPADTIAGRIWELLGSGDRDIDTIIRSVSRPSASVNEALVELELEGLVIRNGSIISRL